MADAGEVKAKASIEYDGSGMKQFKEDLASLPQMVGGLGQSAGQAGSELANLDEGMARNAESAKSFTSAIGELPKMVETGTSSLSGMSGVLSEQRSVVEEAASAHETLQKSVESSISSFEKAPASIQAVSEHTQKLAQSVQTASESFNPSAFGLDDFVRNTEVFQEALSSPTPFSMMKEHLLETGQTWDDFTSSLSASDSAMFSEMTQRTSGSYQVLDKVAGSARTAGAAFTESASGAAEFTKQFNGVAESVTSTNKAINEFGGIGKSLYGPELPPGGVGKTVGVGEIFGGASEGMLNMLNDIAMPLMAIQMVAMAVQYVGQSIYDSAAIAEGAGAHSFGSFTGTVDALGQSVQKVGGQFSESFGRQIMPTLNALNMQASDSGGFWGGVGGFLGGAGSTLFNLAQIGTGSNFVGGMQGLINQGASAMGLSQPFQGPGPISQSQQQYQQQMAALPQTVQANAMQLQYQSNLTLAQAVDPNWLAANNQAMASQRAAQYLIQSYDISHPLSQSQMIQEARYQQYAAQQQQNYQEQIANGGTIGQEIGGYVNAGDWGKAWGSLTGGIGDYFSQGWAKNAHAFSSVGDFFGSWWDNFWGINNSDGSQRAPTTMGGCFVAGTPVLLADGSSKPIEMLRVDDQVLSCDGQRQVPATIIGCIMFPHKQTYELVFDDGKTLITTDSHPIATPDGWKSISPESTTLENPGLPVTTLHVGDSIYTVDGTLCRLISIAKRTVTTVYNITVDTFHTYYAGGILVHNAKGASISANDVGQQTAEQIGGIQLPHIDLSGIAGQIAGSVSGIEMPHIDMSGISGALSGMFSGISVPPMPNIGSEINGALGGIFSGISMPPMPNIGSEINGALGGMFSGISMPSIPEIGGMINGAMSGMFGGIQPPSPPEVGGMISGAMSGIFGGIQPPSPPEVGAMINGAMSGIFAGIQIPAPPNLGSMINSAMSGMFSGISMPSVPFFASGVSNFSGGGAVIGEAGAEVVGYNGRYSLFDQGATFVNLPAGASVYPMQEMGGYSSPRTLANGTGGGGFSPLSIGGGMPQSINVSVHLDSQTILSAIEMPMAQNIRVASGLRSY